MDLTPRKSRRSYVCAKLGGVLLSGLCDLLDDDEERKTGKQFRTQTKTASKVRGKITLLRVSMHLSIFMMEWSIVLAVSANNQT